MTDFHPVLELGASGAFTLNTQVGLVVAHAEEGTGGEVIGAEVDALVSMASRNGWKTLLIRSASERNWSGDATPYNSRLRETKQRLERDIQGIEHECRRKLRRMRAAGLPSRQRGERKQELLAAARSDIRRVQDQARSRLRAETPYRWALAPASPEPLAHVKVSSPDLLLAGSLNHPEILASTANFLKRVPGLMPDEIQRLHLYLPSSAPSPQDGSDETEAWIETKGWPGSQCAAAPQASSAALSPSLQAFLRGLYDQLCSVAPGEKDEPHDLAQELFCFRLFLDQEPIGTHIPIPGGRILAFPPDSGDGTDSGATTISGQEIELHLHRDLQGLQGALGSKEHTRRLRRQAPVWHYEIPTAEPQRTA